MKKVRYLIEYYTDKYKTLHQAIMIDLKLDEASNGMESRYIRSKVNPNLRLYKKLYQDKYYKIIKEEKLVNDEWIVEEVEE